MQAGQCASGCVNWGETSVCELHFGKRSTSSYTWILPSFLCWSGEGGRRKECLEEEEDWRGGEGKGERFRGDRRTASWLHFPFTESPHSPFCSVFCLILLSEGESQRDKESFTVQY
ncbi:hypothetical protein CHARACLAT_005460 [Characodon lateralis]|uniref:Uncharacterized protein n=1 Tax=Characodon lateralis TaxID=208331 RepID=A0ABU7E8J8_9TELE|nr:hypothetical protein [Characodon lateralis]